MPAVIQRLIVMPDEGDTHQPTIMDAPVKLINPDGTPYTGGTGRRIPYLPENTTLKVLRKALLDAGLMEPDPQAEPSTSMPADTTRTTDTQDEETASDEQDSKDSEEDSL